ncbi:adenylate kinase [Gryllotalpicola reticulitermitis]|uniref:Adenylate kinase n=1 Tax=Gryllotalpicola reticulitermitis TaxID=1184153 RepID=A0ABV8Q6H7_9MICO
MSVPLAPRRILLHGATGSGKSTAAVRIAAILGRPVTLADEIGWLPGWRERPVEEQRAMVQAAAAGDSWVFDSAYSKWRDLVMPSVDLIIGLDYSRWLSLTRLIVRTARRVITGEFICNGNRETLRKALSADSIVIWHFRSWKKKRVTMRAWSADQTGPPTILFRRPRDLEAWIGGLTPVKAGGVRHPLD